MKIKHISNILLILLVAVSTVASNGATKDAACPQYAIRAGKILTMAPQTNPQKMPHVINHGIILISNGKIEALGPKDEVTIPKGYTVIDASDRWVMPGIVEAHSHIGAASFGDLNDMVTPTNPELCMADVLDGGSREVKQAFTAGVTTIHLIPGSGTNHAGFGVILKPFSESDEPTIVRPLGAMKIAQAYNPERQGGDLGRTRMGMSWILRDFLKKARAYNNIRQNYETGKTDKKPACKPAWEATRDAIQSEIPVLIHTASAKDVMATARIFHDEFALDTIVSHATFDGFKVAHEMAKRNVHINIGPRQVDFYNARDNKFYGLADEYQAAGVRNLSINTDAPVVPQEDISYQVAMAVRHGLDEATGLQAITINPARALGIDDRVGSLEVGKDADIVIKKSSLLDPATPVDLVLVNGNVYQRKNLNLIKESQS